MATAGTSAAGALGALTRVGVTVVAAASYVRAAGALAPVIPPARTECTVGGAAAWVISCEGVPQPIHVFLCRCPTECAPSSRGSQHVVDLREVIKVYDGAAGSAPLDGWVPKSVRASTRAKVEAGLVGTGVTPVVHCINGGLGVKCAVPVWLAMNLLSRAPTPWGRLWQHGLMSSPEFTSWFSANCCSPPPLPAVVAAGGGGAAGASAAAPGEGAEKKPAGEAYTGASAKLPFVPLDARRALLGVLPRFWFWLFAPFSPPD